MDERYPMHYLTTQGQIYQASKDEPMLLVINRLRDEVKRIEDKDRDQAARMYGLLDALCHRREA